MFKLLTISTFYKATLIKGIPIKNAVTETNGQTNITQRNMRFSTDNPAGTRCPGADSRYFVTSSDYPDFPDSSKSYPDFSRNFRFLSFLGYRSIMLTASKSFTDVRTTLYGRCMGVALTFLKSFIQCPKYNMCMCIFSGS